MKHPKLRSIPPANRQPGNLARVARYGKGQPRAAAMQETSTSFQPHVIAPDPRIKEAKDAYCAALQRRRAEVERAIAEAALPEEAEFWRSTLQRLGGD